MCSRLQDNPVAIDYKWTTTQPLAGSTYVLAGWTHVSQQLLEFFRLLGSKITLQALAGTIAPAEASHGRETFFLSMSTIDPPPSRLPGWYCGPPCRLFSQPATTERGSQWRRRRKRYPTCLFSSSSEDSDVPPQPIAAGEPTRPIAATARAGAPELAEPTGAGPASRVSLLSEEALWLFRNPDTGSDIWLVGVEHTMEAYRKVRFGVGRACVEV